VTLRCTPKIEESILRRLVAAIEGYHPTGVFERLSEIRCPVLIATTEHSNPRFARMAEIAQRHIAYVTIEHLSGVGHAAPQVAPERIASLAQRFWGTAAATSRSSARTALP
jgi:pimeloyl-ACP methyl ester carboxylesterase